MDLVKAKSIISSFPEFCKALSIAAYDYSKPANNDNPLVIKPFTIAQHQRELIDYISSGKHTDRVILKTRQIGATTILLAWLLWRVLYHRTENIIYLCISDTIAETNYEQLRTWMTQLGEYAPVVKCKEMSINNKFAGSKIWFTTATDKKGRASTYSRSVFDEISYYDPATQNAIRSAFNASSPSCRIWLSTPRRENDIYHNLVKQSIKDDDLFKLDWYDDRLLQHWFGNDDVRDSWFDVFSVGLPQAQINREYLCKFKGAVEAPIWECPTLVDYTYDPAKPVIVSLDPGYNPDPTAILYAQYNAGKLVVFDEDQVKRNTSPQIAARIKSRGYNLIYGTMDAAAKKIDQTSGISIYDDLARLLGIRFYTRKPPDRILLRNHTQRLLNTSKVVISNDCRRLIDMLNNFEYSNVDTIPSKSPYKHIHDSLVYLVYNFSKNQSKDHLKPRNINRNILPQSMW